MLIFDTHAHYDDAKFDEDRLEFLNNLHEHGVLGIVNVGADIPTSEESVEYSKKFNNVFAAVGIHPYGVDSLGVDYIQKLKRLSKQGKVVAIGEIGLDYHFEKVDKSLQRVRFEEQLDLAKSLELPVILHSRDACHDTLEVLTNQTPQSFVMHCFSYGLETAEKLLAMGSYLGFTGIITFKNAKKAIEVLKVAPLDRILVETDCPYLAPEPYRGKRADSGMLNLTAKKIADIKQCELTSLVEILNRNAAKFYRQDLEILN